MLNLGFEGQFSPRKKAATGLGLLTLIILVIAYAVIPSRFFQVDLGTVLKLVEQEFKVTDSPPLIPPVTVTPSLSATVSALPSSASAYLVTRVVDGDTLEVTRDSQTHKVRLIGVDTPETVDPRRPVQCFGKAASEHTKELLMDKEVILVKDVSETDQYGRWLRYVYLADGTFVNQQLVAGGYAQARAYPPDVKYQTEFRFAEQAAREQKRGMWGEGVCL